MLEIVLVYFLCKSMGKILRAKGRKPLPLQIMLVVFWVGGEFMGGVVSGIVHIVQHGDAPMEFSLWTYVYALAGAASGAAFCFIIASVLPPAEPADGINRDGTGGPYFPPSDPSNPYSSPHTRD